ncbi:hypothetical protein [Microbacterium hibisci]|uniref:hypothetical protein n=1 Tax=Microbacterium hibisci TaxID=2036000 RepID=UPI001EF37549|nr:hypothetical protein [Microbacterium hibisci]
MSAGGAEPGSVPPAESAAASGSLPMPRSEPGSPPSGAAPAPTAPQKRPAYEPPARLLRPTGYDPDMPRPATTVAGVCLILLRVLAGVVVLAAIAAGWEALLDDPDTVLEGFDPSPEGAQAALWVVLAVGGAVLLIDLLLAVFVFRGHNWARVIVMLIAVGSISTSFFAWWAQGQEIQIDGTYVSLSLDILLLLALSSRSAAAYARRREQR